jgi:ribonuclease BN (tRNA processing enzyme)
MRITVLGGCGAWPSAGQACSGFLVEHDGFRLVVDLGYAVLPRLLEHTTPHGVDAALISHGHPDHCADLHPLLRSRALDASPPPALPVFAPPEALDAVLALDGPGALSSAYVLHEFAPGGRFEVGPFEVGTWLLPHWVPNAGIRLTAGGRVVAYTGDTGPCAGIVELARDADVFIAEATHAEEVPAHSTQYLSSARQAGRYAAEAGAGRLLLTHLWPGSDRQAAMAAARRAYHGEIAVADSGLVIDLR